MLLSYKTTVHLEQDAANLVGHMCYAAYKLWNVCNYERRNYKELGMEQYPDWYDQKSRHKDNMWFKSLPSQTSQEVCKQLDKAWKSFYTLKRTGGIEHPNPPRFKQNGMEITYMQNGIQHAAGSEMVRLSLPKRLKEYMALTYGICETYLYLKNRIFQNTDTIKQIRMYPPDAKGLCDIIVIYEISDKEQAEDNGHYLSIDIGLHNLLTCYDSDGRSMIFGRRYLNICHRYDKELARVQSQWGRCQASKGIEYPKPSKKIRKRYEKKKNSVRDYLHKVTHAVTVYCEEHDIHTVIIGDITGIRRKKDLGSVTNQKLHGLPYKKVYEMLAYKLKKIGIRLCKQEESYTSQCSPYSEEVSKKYATKSSRVKRGLYVTEGKIYHADAVGAYNILRKYLAVSGIKKELPVTGLDRTEMIKTAV